MTASRSPLRFGTRASRLARWQTATIGAALRRVDPAFRHEEIVIETTGDRDRRTPLPEIGGKGLFTEALEAALLAGEIDVAVHSLKDLPIHSRPGLVNGAIGYRADPRDVLVAREGWTLATLPSGARVGTSSTRRVAQLRAFRRDLQLDALRGNVDTRVRKALAGQYDAVCIAAAGVERLELTDAIAEYLPLARMLPAPGQGALAVQCRADDEAVRARLALIDDRRVRAAVDAERGFLDGLGGGCSAPIAALGTPERDNGTLHLDGLVGAVDGSQVIRVAGSGPVEEAWDLGHRLADDALAQGAGALVT